MKSSRKKSQYRQLFIVFLSMILFLTTTLGFSVKTDGPEITINTDQLEYYPGEQVTVHGRITADGQGVPSSPLCVNVNDSEGNTVFGSCGLSDSYGNYSFTFSLDGEALLGTYPAEVHSYTYDIRAYTSFDVVATVVTVEASGPCSGVAGIPVSFSGLATGGKKPYGWAWNFGDQQVSSEQNPNHCFSTPGNYTVVLMVTDKEGHSGTDTLIITILPGENQQPDTPTINGPSSGKIKTEYTYNLSAVDPDGDQVYFWVEWCDDCADASWIGPFDSGEIVSVKHSWEKKGAYTIRVKAKDTLDAESAWTTLEVSMPKDARIFQGFFYQFLKTLFPRIFGTM